MSYRFQMRERAWRPAAYVHDPDWSGWRDVNPADVELVDGAPVLDVSWVDGMDIVQVRVVFDATPSESAVSPS